MKKLIALIALTASMTAMADSNYACFGTEPFWDLKITKDQTVFNGFFEDESTKTEPVLSKEQANGTTEDYAFVVTTASATSTVVRTECNDGMSDELYPYTIVYKTQSEVLFGCCREAK